MLAACKARLMREFDNTTRPASASRLKPTKLAILEVIELLSAPNQQR